MRIPLALLIYMCLLLAYASAEEASVALTVRPVPEDFFDKAIEGQCPDIAEKSDALFVTGIFNAPTFSIKEINNVTVTGTDGITIPLIIDKSSLYSEFEGAGINSMKFGFVISKSVIEKGAPTLTWGESISASNIEVEKIEIFAQDRVRYRTFSWEAMPKGGDNPYVATIEVIVDDYADVYYLWYLLPMALIFSLLFVKKAFLR